MKSRFLWKIKKNESDRRKGYEGRYWDKRKAKMRKEK